MDELRFDDVVRTLSERGTRRGALRLLASGVLGALVGTPAASALAKSKKKKKSNCAKKCPQGQQRNKRSCKCECSCIQCSGGKEFDAESCTWGCPRGMRECRDGCVGLTAAARATHPALRTRRGAAMLQDWTFARSMAAAASWTA